MQNATFDFYNPIDMTTRRVVASYEDVSSDDGSLTRTVAFSICNPEDRFNRKRGQMIANKRLEDGRTAVTIFSNAIREKKVQDSQSGNQFNCTDDTMWATYRRVLLTRIADTAAGKKSANLINYMLESGDGVENPMPSTVFSVEASPLRPDEIN